MTSLGIPVTCKIQFTDEQMVANYFHYFQHKSCWDHAQLFIPAKTLCRAYFRGEFSLINVYAACSSIKADRRSQSSEVMRIKIAAASPWLPICFKHSHRITAHLVAASGNLKKLHKRWKVAQPPPESVVKTWKTDIPAKICVMIDGIGYVVNWEGPRDGHGRFSLSHHKMWQRSHFDRTGIV